MLIHEIDGSKPRESPGVAEWVGEGKFMFTARMRLLVLFTLAAGIAPAAIAQHIEASEADTQAIKAVNEQFSQDWNKHDSTAIATLFTTDSLLVALPG